MPPKSVAQRQKEYRERLKNENPDKLKEIMKKNSDRAREHYREKIQNLTKEQKKEKRLNKKEQNNLTLTINTKTQQEPTTKNVIRNLQRRLDGKLRKQNEEVQKLWRGFKNLQKRCHRQQKKIEKLEETCNSLQTELNTFKTPQAYPIPLTNEYTPLKRTEEYVNENLNSIKTPQKAIIKKTILEHNVLTESLKAKFNSSSNVDKNTLKEILDNDIVRKYKLKSSLTRTLGLKSNFKKYRDTKHKRKELINKIKDFYIKDDVSRASAGKKEYKTINKTKIQKRYLLDNLSALHKKYVREVGQISFSTFKKYRPRYVVRPSTKDLESCACVKHSNMQFMAVKLKSLGLLETDKLNDIISSLVCDKNFKTCMYGDCPSCSAKLIHLDGNEVLSEKVTWNLWTIVTYEYGEIGNMKKTKKMTKTEKNGSVQDLVDMFNKNLIIFKKHVFNVHHQYLQYKYCLENLKENEVLVHIDFSENWTAKHHEEVQAMHFGAAKTQITLHTGVYYTKDAKIVSFCTVSPDNQHNPEAIWAHLNPILKDIRSTYPNINQIHFFSDGPTTQYRQKKNFYLFCRNIYHYNFAYGTWSFFEASHGKGAADGIGGAVKRSLDSKVSQGQDIPNAEKAFDVLMASETTIKIFFIPAAKIQILVPDTGTRLIPLKNTMKVHQLITENKFYLKHRELSCFCKNLDGRCDCYSPQIHRFVQSEYNAEKSNEDYILDEVTGEIYATRFEEPVSEHNMTEDIFQEGIAILDDQDITDHIIEYAGNIEHDGIHEEVYVDDFENRIHNVSEVLYDNSEEEDETYSVHDSSYGSTFLEETLQDCSMEISEAEDNNNEEELCQQSIEAKSHVLVKFDMEKRVKYYIGQVLECNERNNYKVKFMRNKGNGKFAWPIIDDISTIYTDDIERVLPNPIYERRGIKTFDLSKINFKIE